MSREQRSLFGEILDWMLVPLLLLWPMSAALTWLVAQNIAARPYDRDLAQLTQRGETQLDDEDVGFPNCAAVGPQVVGRLHRDPGEGQRVAEALGNGLGVYGGDHRMGR